MPADVTGFPSEGELPLEELGLTVRTFNLLRRWGVLTIGDLARRHRSQLESMPNVGMGTMREVDAAMEAHGLRFADTVYVAGSRPQADPRPQQEDGGPGAGQPAYEGVFDFGWSDTTYDADHGEASTSPATEPEAPAASRQRERQDAMIRLRREGATLAEIGREFGLTRERVRQILRQGGFDGDRARRERTERQREAAWGAREQILREFRRGVASAETARRLGIPSGAVKDVVDEIAESSDRAARRSNRIATSRPIYSDEELLDAVREIASRYGRAPTSPEYARIASTDGLPSLPTVHKRFGSWNAALNAAGIHVQTPRKPYTRRWTEAACWRALKRLVVELGAVPTADGYDTMAQLDDELPSLATVRNRLGRWSSVTGELARLPSPSTALERLGVSRGTDQETLQVTVWMAFLEDRATEDDLAALILAERFFWESSFGPPPPAIAQLL